MLINALQGIETFDFVFWKLIIKKEIKVIFTPKFEGILM